MVRSLPLRPRRAHGLAAMLAASLLLTGCGSGNASPATPSSTQSTGVAAPFVGGASSGAPSSDGLPSEWPAPVELSAEGIGALDLHTISDNARRTHVVVPQIPGAEHLNEHLRDEAQERVDAFWKESDGGTEAPTLNGRWGVVGMSGRILGVVTNVTETRGAAAVMDGHTHWFDAESGDVVHALDLVGSDHEADLVKAVRETVTRLPGASADRAEEDLRNERVRTWFSPEGDLMVGFDEHTVLPEAEGMPAVSVPAADVAGWLSPAGEAVREAVLHPDVAAWNAAHQRTAAASSSAASASAAAEVGAAAEAEDEARAAAEREAAAGSAAAAPSSSAPSARPAPTAKPAPTTKAAGAGDTDCSVKKCVALTFDDGPKPATDGPLLKILAAHDVKATFFMLGKAVDTFPDTAREIAAAGHELGNHSTTHPLLDGLTPKQVSEELQQASESIHEATGTWPKVMRPPYGATNASVKQAIADHGMRQTLWDVDTRDWEHKNPAKTLANVKALTGRDSIILMHDIHPTSVAAVDDVITWLEGQGYTLVTVSDLQDG